MQTAQLDNGILNNYAQEPKMYYAQYPSYDQQQRYKLQGGIAALFVSALIFTSIAISAIVG
ncbi:MAG: ssl1498 family light-harvesting-like protein [Okeania sp. SIO2D1]|nr:ssl1498 family light-harvesting-like protein [Okeania sp. SIO2D1]